MIVEAIHPDTGEKIQLDLPKLTEEQVRQITAEHATEEQLQRRLDSLPLSADGKAMLAKLLRVTVTFGKTVVKLGKKVVEIAVYVASNFPKVTFWTVLGAVLSFLISLIPAIGPIIGGFLTPILLIGGLAKGFYEQWISSDPRVVTVLAESTESFKPLQGMTA